MKKYVIMVLEVGHKVYFKYIGAWQGRARLGLARPGLARLGEATQDKARFLKINKGGKK